MHDNTPEDRAKIDTWFDVIRLVQHYRDIAFDPLYQPPKGFAFVSKDHTAVRDRKLARIREYEVRLAEKWKLALGPDWASSLEPD